MSIPIPLIQDDRNVLVDLREDTEDQNTLLATSQKLNLVDLAKLLLIDVPFKKQTDSAHGDIFYFEEELRRLTGESIPQPLQELSFTISDSSTSARLYVNNGRVKLVEDSVTVLDVPIVPFRGYSYSQIAIGTNFDIWSRDRFGSSTSKPNGSSTFTIDSSNRKLRAKISGYEQEIDFTELFTLPQVLAGGAVASSLQAIFQSIEVGSVLSKNAEPYILYEGDKLSLSVNGGAPIEAEFTMGNALYVTSNEQDYFTFMNGDILNVVIDEGTKQPLIFVFPPENRGDSTQNVYDDQGNIIDVIVTHNIVPVERQTLTIEDVAIRMNEAWAGIEATIDISTGKKRIKLQLTTAGYHNFQFSNESNLQGVGTISTAIGSANIVGVGTKFTETFQSGDRITILGESQFRVINIISDDTHLSVTTPVSIATTNVYYYVGSGNSDPIAVLGFTDVMYGTFSAQQVINVLSAVWIGMTFTAENGYIRISKTTPVLTDTFQITDGAGTPNQIIGFSEHLILQNTNFQTCSMMFNTNLNCFTLAAGVAGVGSSAEILPASSDDMRITLGFDSQFQIAGRWSNNLLKVEIDGDEKEIKIADFRQCFNDALLGDNNDDIGFYWSRTLGYLGTTRVGPLFCSGINNGKDVAKSIQAQLRAVGTGGFKEATCWYFSDKQQFVIYSGSFGAGSIAHVVPTGPDPKYCTALLGFEIPLEERGNETYYNTVGELAAILDTITNVAVSTPTDPDVIAYSVLLQKETGIKLDNNFQLFPFMTTEIYDNGALGLPRLYPDGTVTIDDTNDKINFTEETNVEITATIAHNELDDEGNIIPYTAGDLAAQIQDALNAATQISVAYTVEYQTRSKKFIIHSSIATKMLWNSGANKLTSVGDLIGFNTNVDTGPTTLHIANRRVSFTGNYFQPTFIS
jgi:hypothetical protein